ncbi:Nramp family divalent metal transporter [Microbacterium sp. YY-01]|uniref:Nramp family divalent metal transporter n=1 Tax=Microbacterium sp. YY-01 TaxID=3421634 RepID=UPI003D167DB9
MSEFFGAPKKSLPAPRSARFSGVALLGPALVAGVAYLDPGNVAANMSAGALYGYLLVWVIVAANTMAWLVQYLSAKLGVVTGRSLPEILGERIGHRWARRLYWLQAELVAIATDLAEIIGGAVALHLLFGLPLLLGGVITGAVSIGILAVHNRRGARPFEHTIVALMIIITAGFVAGLFIAPPDPAGIATGMLPRFTDSGSVLLAASILGATIMPHAIYAHSALTRDRFHAPTAMERQHPDATTPATTAAPSPVTAPAQRIRTLLRATRWDVTIAMVVAGSVNLAMLLLAAANLAGVDGTDTLDGAYHALADHLGPIIAVMFAVALLASGLASTAVGAYAGADIMHGLLHIRVPLLTRRLITLIPALAILAAGIDPTLALILSQVALSFGIPFALVPLLVVTAQRRTLGAFTNRAITTAVGALCAVLLIALNIALIVLTALGV